ncbi:hypothetical protein FRX31_016270, partial [Thalictrum thalictroides]
MEISWQKQLPLKIKVFIWTTHLDRIRTNCNLLKKGKMVEPICSACRMLNEDVTRLLLYYSKSLE